jgi:hypothetical protein
LRPRARVSPAWTKAIRRHREQQAIEAGGWDFPNVGEYLTSIATLLNWKVAQ